MDNQKIAEFFDGLAAEWDSGSPDQSSPITFILDNAGPLAGKDVLDVGAGTGVLVPWLLERKVSSITECDLSEGMLRENRRKWGDDGRVSYFRGDASHDDFGRKYDLVMIYNAFPHFSDRKALIDNIADHLREGGRFVIAHSMTSEELDAHHHNISTELYEHATKAEGVAVLLEERFTGIIWNDSPYYFIRGTLRTI